MSLLPFRFLHASRLMLDHQLQEIGPLPESLREVAQDATLLAFHNLIEQCLSQQIDFLLLTGDCFDAADLSIRAQAELARGLERLAEQRIPTFILPGQHDPQPAWLSEIRYPSLVHRFDSESSAPVPVKRDEQLLALIYGFGRLAGTAGVSPPSYDSRLPTTSEAPFSIGLLPETPAETGEDTAAPMIAGFNNEALQSCTIDYWGCGGGVRQTQPLFRGTLHAPGPLQALGPNETGLCGATLVEVSADGSIRSRQLPLGVVRWELRDLEIDPDWRRENLLAALQESVAAFAKIPSDRICFVSWELVGDSPLNLPLEDAGFRVRLLEELNQLGRRDGVQIISRQIRCSRTADSEEGLLPEFAELRSLLFPEPADTLPQVIDRCGVESKELQTRLETWAAGANRELLNDELQELAKHWFETTEG